MEQITVTKEELLELVEKAVSKRLDNVKSKGPKQIFTDVEIKPDELKEVNQKFFIPISPTNMSIDLYNTLSIWKFNKQVNVSSNKSNIFMVHDNLRILTQRALGASRNTEIYKEDYEFAEECYKELKDKFLELYEKHLERNLTKKTESNGNC